MAETSQLPTGGVDSRKYAAISLALGLVRGALLDALAGNLDDVSRIMDLTSTPRIAEALDCKESDLAIIWDEHLTPSEVNRIKGW
jgi:hypothetical protein